MHLVSVLIRYCECLAGTTIPEQNVKNVEFPRCNYKKMKQTFCSIQ